MGSFSLKSSPVGQSLSLSSRGSFVVGSLSLTGIYVKEMSWQMTEGKVRERQKRRSCGIGRGGKGMCKSTIMQHLTVTVMYSPLMFSNPAQNVLHGSCGNTRLTRQSTRSASSSPGEKGHHFQFFALFTYILPSTVLHEMSQTHSFLHHYRNASCILPKSRSKESGVHRSLFNW